MFSPDGIMFNLLAAITGITWKIYDDVVDGDCPYKVPSFRLLQSLVIGATCLMMYDLNFLVLMLAVVTCNTLHLVLAYLFKYPYANALDTNLWVGGVVPILLSTWAQWEILLPHLIVNRFVWIGLTTIFFIEMGVPYQRSHKIAIRSFLIVASILLARILDGFLPMFIFIISYFTMAILHARKMFPTKHIKNVLDPVCLCGLCTTDL